MAGVWSRFVEDTDLTGFKNLVGLLHLLHKFSQNNDLLPLNPAFYLFSVIVYQGDPSYCSTSFGYHTGTFHRQILNKDYGVSAFYHGPVAILMDY